MRGKCLCGNIQFKLRPPFRSIVACHCMQCRKTSGHYVAATQIATNALSITGESFLTWYASSDTARRGFCSVCGSQLFWQPLNRDTISIMAGSLEQTNDLKMDRQIYSEAKADYYELPDVKCVHHKDI